MTFTTRPELLGTFGMVSTTHWLASQAGMRMLEAGGTAADAAVAAGFVLNVVEPHLNGPLGEVPALVLPAGADTPIVLCGQGVAPAAATIARYRDAGLDIIPGSGLLATVTPGAFDAWMLMLRDHGRLSLAEVLAPAIHYAAHGHPMLPAVASAIAGLQEVFRREWPTSAPVWLPGDRTPEAGALFRNPDCAAMWRRLVAEAEAAGGDREAQIEAARRAHAQGFVAEAIDDYLREACVLDATGERRRGVLTAQDMAGWQATWEAPLAVDHAGWTVWKCGAWTQGPVMLQVLQMLVDDDLAAQDPVGPATVHLVTEALKRAFADREAYYGDPAFHDIPVDTLLSAAHNAAHRADIGEAASLDFRPGAIAGLEAQAKAFLARAARRTPEAGVGAGEPTMAHLVGQRGDTVHVDVVDRWGNMVSATPSGGWLKSNPVVPGLGVPLNTRAQMFWLDEGLPTSLAPGARPRTTLSPSMARAPDGTDHAFGTPGGDQQDQWQTIFLLRLIHHGMNLQEAIDGPLFHTGHLQSSFHPRAVQPGHLLVEPAFREATIEALAARGHRIEVSAPWSAGRLCAVARRPDGVVKGAATPRLMQAYAVGR
jgi:gamma-glutamyltranspeptidase/glutathione hydrolase